MQHILLYGDFFMKKYLRNYVEDNINNIIMIFLCIIIGLVIGIIIFNTSDINTKDQLIKGVNETLEISKNDNFECIDILYNGIILTTAYGLLASR